MTIGNKSGLGVLLCLAKGYEIGSGSHYFWFLIHVFSPISTEGGRYKIMIMSKNKGDQKLFCYISVKIMTQKNKTDNTRVFCSW